MDYPIYEKEKAVGLLHRESEGLYTVFRAKLPPGQGLSRLWLVGEQGAFCLGLLEPRPCGRFFHRRFSRRELQGLPTDISHAVCAGERETVRLPEKKKEEKVPVPQMPPAKRQGELCWRPSSMGCYTAHDGLSQLLAIPARLRCRHPLLRLVQIRGQSYLVFRY